MANHIIKQWNTYSARWRVPHRHQAFYEGKKELRKTLHTGDKQLAIRRAALVVENWRRQAEQGNHWEKHLNDLPADGELAAIGVHNGQEILRPFNREEHVLDVLTGVLPDNEVDTIVASDDYREAVSKEIISLQQYLEPFLMRQTATQKTIDQKRHDLQMFLSDFPYYHLCKRKPVQHWFDSQDRATPTLKRALGSIRALLNYVALQEDDRGLEDDPLKRVEAIGQRKPTVKEDFTRAELVSVYEGITRDDHKLFLRILATSGMRAEEACTATYEDDGRIVIRKSKTKAGERTLPLHSSISVHEVQEWQRGLKAGPYGRMSHYTCMSLNRALKKLGFGKSKTVHSVRRYVAVALERLGVPELTTARILGHEVQTLSYGLYGRHDDWQGLRETIEQLEGLG